MFRNFHKIFSETTTNITKKSTRRCERLTNLLHLTPKRTPVKFDTCQVSKHDVLRVLPQGAPEGHQAVDNIDSYQSLDRNFNNQHGVFRVVGSYVDFVPRVTSRVLIRRTQGRNFTTTITLKCPRNTIGFGK